MALALARCWSRIGIGPAHHQLIAKMSKSSFGRTRVDYQGNILSASVVEVGVSKVEDGPGPLPSRWPNFVPSLAYRATIVAAASYVITHNSQALWPIYFNVMLSSGLTRPFFLITWSSHSLVTAGSGWRTRKLFSGLGVGVKTTDNRIRIGRIG